MDIHINQTSKAEIFAALFQHIKLFTEHVNIMFSEDKMFIQSMDSSRVSIFEIYLPASWFDVYTHTRPGGITIGINAILLFKVLNARDKNQLLHIKFDDNNNDKLYLNFTSESNTVFDKHFEIPLIDIDVETMGIPDIDYQAEFSIPSINFAILINQLQMFGDTLQIECSEEKIQLSSTSSESGKMFVEIPIDDLTSFSILEGERLNLSFSLAHLHNVCLYNKLSRDVEINMSANYPIKMVYSLGQMDAKFIFYLAPKINDNDDD